jgi:hypothetical protein
MKKFEVDHQIRAWVWNCVLDLVEVGDQPEVRDRIRYLFRVRIHFWGSKWVRVSV